MAQYEKGIVYHISIIDFKLDPDQPRKVIDDDALAELAASIKKHGILLPLLFRVGDQGWLLIVSGERRYLAAKQAGLLILPAMRVEGNHAEIALVENLLRQDLTPVEEAEALKRLMDDQHYSQEQLAGVIGKSRTSLNESLSLTRLPAVIRDECRSDRRIAKTLLVEIARKKQERGMMTAYEQIKERMRREQEGRKPRGEKKSPAAALCEVLGKTKDRLRAADIAEWSEDDVHDVQEAVAGLREALDAFENPPAGDGGESPPRMALS